MGDTTKATPVAPPTFVASSLRRNPSGSYTLTIDCVCGRKHTHGWAPEDGTTPTHRVRHCGTGRRYGVPVPPPAETDHGYYVVVTPEQVQAATAR